MARLFGDTSDFVRMMQTIREQGFYGIYESNGIVYPPLAQFYFWGIERLLDAFGIPIDVNLRIVTFFIKFPCIVCVFLMGGLLYKIAGKYMQADERVLILYLVLFNPAYLFATGYVCQVDAIYTCLMCVMVSLLVIGKLKLSYFVFAAAILFKFQSVFITPVLIFAIADQVVHKDFAWKRFFGELFTGIGAIACMFLLYLPFVYDAASGTYSGSGFLGNFSATTAGFGKASQNAYNFWTLAGYNQIPQTEMFGPFSCQTWGKIFIVFLVALGAFLHQKKKGTADRYPMLAALMISGAYCFSVRMMSRYLYPAIIMLFLGYALKPTRKRFWCALLMTVVCYLSMAIEYLVYPWNIYHKELLLPYVISFLMLGCFCFLVYVIWDETNEERCVTV